jgi:hypothetical protein
MAKTRQNFRIYKGEQKTLLVDIVDDDDEPVNVSGCTILYHVAKTRASAQNIIEKGSPDVTVSGDDSNTVNIPFIHADTSEQEDGIYYHELRITNEEADLVVMTGLLVIDSSITYPPSA